MPRLSRKNIEAIASRIITAYKRMPTLQGQIPDMIQPELLAHDLLGLTFEYHTLSRSGGILGLTACGEVDVQIYDDPRHPAFRDDTVRQLISSIKVLDKERLFIRFKDGTELEQTIESIGRVSV